MRSFGQMAWLSVASLGLVAAASGCTSITDHRGYIIDQALVDAVQPGVDNRQSVEKTLGRPTFTSQFGPQDWYYISQNVKTPPFRRPRTSDQVIYRLRFDAAGNVAAIDKRGMEKVARLNPEGDKTPTLGRNRGLLEDLFGNVGTVGAGGGGAGAPSGGPNGSQ
ncbi:outer membrane protein assembly factor BamE (lipoprotein component of BamABCDE complex) [Novosphingobium chloroacetimidivorans]|uniref:Outer membrane protein assembly factor BamE (Lipoprotein component of BamABCDE complex) n=1 Tax=Novosphingobium chloroacetimidivorans TaxID=1428314 RepID=A0A7W7KED1_9SPHN|nr:outer membrane protein assembly factor BamE (lipoprotein component of BamABCDE complex) [Novosphingobium chloroacetimidivorans]